MRHWHSKFDRPASRQRSRAARIIDRTAQFLVFAALLFVNVALWGRVALFIFTGGE